MSRRSALVQHSSPVALESIHLTKRQPTLGTCPPTDKSRPNPSKIRTPAQSFVCHCDEQSQLEEKRPIDGQEETRKLADDLICRRRAGLTLLTCQTCAPPHRLLVVANDAENPLVATR
jgi:hypothetical protein